MQRKTKAGAPERRSALEKRGAAAPERKKAPKANRKRTETQKSFDKRSAALYNGKELEPGEGRTSGISIFPYGANAR